jgi:hypothetical protein
MSWAKGMIDRTTLKEYGERDGVAVVTFDDGRELQIIPEWGIDSVKGIEGVHLFDSGEMVAEVRKGSFWSNGKVDQRELGAYCAFAITLEREVYRYYRQGKIAEDEWQKRFRNFWKVVIKSRQVASALAQTQLPTRGLMGVS